MAKTELNITYRKTASEQKLPSWAKAKVKKLIEGIKTKKQFHDFKVKNEKHTIIFKYYPATERVTVLRFTTTPKKVNAAH